MASAERLSRSFAVARLSALVKNFSLGGTTSNGTVAWLPTGTREGKRGLCRGRAGGAGDRARGQAPIRLEVGVYCHALGPTGTDAWQLLTEITLVFLSLPFDG